MEPKIVRGYPNIKTRFHVRVTMLVVVLVLALVATGLWRGRRQPPSTPEAPPAPDEIRAAGPYL